MRKRISARKRDASPLREDTRDSDHFKRAQSAHPTMLTTGVDNSPLGSTIPDTEPWGLTQAMMMWE